MCACSQSLLIEGQKFRPQAGISAVRRSLNMSQEEVDSGSSDHERQSEEEETEPKGKLITRYLVDVIRDFGCVGDSDYVPPEKASSHQQEQQRRLSVSNLTSPLKNEPTGEYDQKLVCSN